MDTLKKFFPLSFKRTDTVANLVVGILIYLVAGIIAGVLIGVAGWIAGILPDIVGNLVGWALRLIGTVVDLYVLAGIVIQILVFAKVIKD